MPAEASAPPQRLSLLLLRRQQEHHAAGHQDVPQRVRVVVVVLRLSKNVQAHPHQGAAQSGDEVKGPALPGGWVAVSAADASVHLRMEQKLPRQGGRASWWTEKGAHPGGGHQQYGTEDGAQHVPQTLAVQLHRHGYQQSSQHEQSLAKKLTD